MLGVRVENTTYSKQPHMYSSNGTSLTFLRPFVLSGYETKEVTDFLCTDFLCLSVHCFYCLYRLYKWIEVIGWLEVGRGPVCPQNVRNYILRCPFKYNPAAPLHIIMRRALQATRCCSLRPPQPQHHHHHQSRKQSFHVYTHGEGFLGALGHGDFSAREEATPVDALASRDLCSASAGWTHSAAVCRDTGEVLVWGRPFDLKQPLRINRIQRLVPLVVTAVNALASSREVLPSPVSVPLVAEPGEENSKSDTIAAAFRDNRPERTRKQHEQPLPPPPSSDHIRAKSVACSAALTVVLGEDGRVYCMGYNRWGQCGQGPENVFTVFKPLRVGCGNTSSSVGGRGALLEHEKITKLAVGFQQVLVLCESGRVFGWGKGLRGQLGIGGEMTELPEQGKPRAFKCAVDESKAAPACRA